MNVGRLNIALTEQESNEEMQIESGLLATEAEQNLIHLH